MSATTIPQPPHHPVLGPKARVPQVKVVPQSGSALFNALYPYETHNMGMKAMIVMIGACSPLIAMTTKPRVAARLYAGAVDATPTTTEDTNPSAPPLRPLSAPSPCSASEASRCTTTTPRFFKDGSAPYSRSAGISGISC